METEPGPLADEKSDSTNAHHPQPQAAETESARLLANQARDALRSKGLGDDEVRMLADEYIALDLGEDLDEFIAWATKRHAMKRAL